MGSRGKILRVSNVERFAVVSYVFSQTQKYDYFHSIENLFNRKFNVPKSFWNVSGLFHFQPNGGGLCKVREFVLVEGQLVLKPGSS